MLTKEDAANLRRAARAHGLSHVLRVRVGTGSHRGLHLVMRLDSTTEDRERVVNFLIGMGAKVRQADHNLVDLRAIEPRLWDAFDVVALRDVA